MGSRLTCRRFLATLVTILSVAALGPAASAQPLDPVSKLDPLAREQAARATGWSRVILRAADLQTPESLDPAVANAGGIGGRHLGIINSRTALVPNAALVGLAHNPFV